MSAENMTSRGHLIDAYEERVKMLEDALSVERIREVVREVKAIDWTKQDDLTRYATEVHEGLTKP